MAQIINISDVDRHELRARRKAREERLALEAEMAEDFALYDEAFDLLRELPKCMVVQIVKWCLANLISLSDLRRKYDY